MSRFKGSKVLLPPRSRSGSETDLVTEPVFRQSGGGAATLQPTFPGNFQSAPPAAQTPRASAIKSIGSMERLGFAALVLYIFGYFSRGFEMLPPIHAALILSGACLLIAVINGSLLRGISVRPGQLLVAFSVWMCFSVPFSIWRGGSVDVIVNSWSKSFFIFLVISALVKSVSQVLTMMRTIALAVLCTGIFVLFFGQTVQGRLMATEGTYANSNDLAAALGLGVFLWWFIGNRNVWKGFVALAVIGFLSVLILRTGSRAELVGLAAGAPFILLHYSALGRIRVVAISAVLAIGALAFTPGATRTRLLVLFQGGSSAPRTEAEAYMQQEAGDSTAIRLRLAREAVELALENPIFGVGVGNFAPAEDLMAKEEGLARGAWFTAVHNVYAQVAAEMGIPSLICYVGMLASCWMMLRRTSRLIQIGAHPRLQELQAATSALKALLASLAISGFFSASTYTPLLPTALALVVSLGIAAQAEIAPRK